MTHWLEKATKRDILYIFIALGFTLYFFSLFNGFVADDNVYIVGNPFIKNFNIAAFFLGSSYYSGDITQLAGIYYKPLFTLVTSLLYNLSGGTPFLLHLVQLVIHITNSFLLYILFKRFFSKTLAFYLGILFLVHPGNVESVVYIADLQDVLFFLFGMCACIIALSETIKFKRGLVITCLLLASILSKETGVLFLLTIPVLAYVANRKNFKLISSLPAIVVVIYIFLRFAIAHVFINKTVIAPIMAASWSVKLMTLPKIISSYILLFFFPLHLSWGQHWLVQSISFTNFYLPLIVITTILSILTLMFIKTHGKVRDAFIFFFTMFVVGLGLHAQFIPLDFTFAERWFYFPMAGLIGLVGIGIDILKTKKINVKYVTFISICLLLILFARSFVRTLDWKDDYTLTVHDIQVDPHSFALENNLGFELMKQGRYAEAKNHLVKSIAIYPDQTSLNNLAFTYSKLNEKNQAIATYKKAMQKGDFYITTQNYIAELIRQKDYKGAKKEIGIALGKYPNNPKLWLLLTALDYNMGNTEEAISAAEKANTLSPGIGNFLLLKMQNKEVINL